MAQKYVVVERKNPLKPQEAAKFYAMARSNRRVDTDEVISRVSERSSYSIGELKRLHYGVFVGDEESVGVG